MNKEAVNCPVLPIREIVIFPDMAVPLFVGRKKSINALKHAHANNEKVLVLAQKDAKIENPTTEDLFAIGVYAEVLQCVELPDGNYKVLLKSLSRASLIGNLEENTEYLSGSCQLLENKTDDTGDDEQEFAQLKELTLKNLQYFLEEEKISAEGLKMLQKIAPPSAFVDAITLQLGLPFAKKQDILQECSVYKRLQIILQYMQEKINTHHVAKNVKTRLKGQIDKTQKEYYLNEQLKAIKKELKDIGSQIGVETEEVSDYEEKIKKLKCDKVVKERLQGELRKLSGMNPFSSEAVVIKSYLDWGVELPWEKSSKVFEDLDAAEKILNENHYGIKKIKDRILEYLAVYQRTKKLNGPILCLHGAPGVGKTSLARSIAKATGREFVKISLGGIKDEAEIRGHRKTYVGAMPGKIIQAMKKAKVNNPLFLLDEIDKMGTDQRGDPASALLEVLDPEQRHEFQDHYLELDFDLSKVMFVTTANTLNFLQPLLDRMEAIHIPSYTEEEKIHILENHLLKKQIEDHGLKDGELAIDEGAVKNMIRYYTREAGVRSLNRELAKIARKTVRKILQEKDLKEIAVNSDNLKDFCGVQKFSFDQAEKGGQVGMVTGLAYTEYGGTILPIETVTVPGDGKIKCTGKLGEVMQESVQTAFSYIMSRYRDFGLKVDFYKKIDIHVHVPEGATPKDGPSAGIGICLSILSTLLEKEVTCDLAMTGEITLRGKVFPIGGLKEKLLAAQRSGIKKVLIPKENERDLEEMQELLDKLTVIPVENFEDVRKIALMN